MKKITYIYVTSVLIMAQQFSCKKNQEPRSQARETKTDSQSLQQTLTPIERFQLVSDKIQGAIKMVKPTNAGGRAQLAEVYERYGYTQGSTPQFVIPASAGCNAADYNLVPWPLTQDSKEYPVVKGLKPEGSPSQECANKFVDVVKASIAGMEWFGATSKEYSRDLREYLPSDQVRNDYYSLPVVVGEGLTDEAAKEEIEVRFQVVLNSIPSVQVSVLPTLHFTPAGAPVCVSHSLFVSSLPDPVGSLLVARIDGNPRKDPNVPGAYSPGLVYLSRNANSTKAQLQPFLRQDFVASMMSSRNMAHSKLSFVPVFASGAAIDLSAWSDDEYVLGCEGAPNNRCMILRGVDVNTPAECPIMTVKFYPYD